ncbi:MAG: hypothetical protein LBB58_02270 [Cellulomonadaceae bacterium]|jgi:hypothetical protein|nr:hypothetical protein [Cellulomonadaceae bacterium]
MGPISITPKPQASAIMLNTKGVAGFFAIPMVAMILAGCGTVSSAAGASEDAATVSVTNPDGQPISAAYLNWIHSRVSDANTDQTQLAILEDNWITDEELSEAESLMFECFDAAIPGIEFTLSGFGNMGQFWGPTGLSDEERAVFEEVRPECQRASTGLRAIHFQMRNDPEATLVMTTLQSCLDAFDANVTVGLTDDEINDLIRWDNPYLAENHPVAWQCVVDVTFAPS